MKNFALIALGLTAALTCGTAAHAQPAADHPCVQEVCIGDGLDRLRTIDWQVVAYTSDRVRRMRQADRARRARIYPQFGADGVPSYLIVGKFDRDLLGSMAGVEVACEPHGIEGVYISEGGHRTTVTVSLLPTADPAEMVWRVTAIGRMYRAIDNNAQRAEHLAALNERYGRFVNRQPGESGALIVPMGRETVLSLQWVDVARDRSYGAHPMCERPARISI